MSDRPTALHDEELSALASTTADDVGQLIRAELELAKAELRSEARGVVTGSGMAVVGGFAVVVAVFALVWAAAWGLDEVVPTGAAFAIVGGVVLVVGLLALALGIRRIQGLELLPRTREIGRLTDDG